MSEKVEQKSPSPISRLIAPVTGRIYLACVFQAFSTVSGIVPFIAVGELGRVLLSAAPVDEERAWWIVAAAVVALACRFLFLMTASGLTHLADIDLQLILRRQMAARLSRVALGWFDRRNAGAVKKALQDDVTALHHLVGHSYTDMVSALITPAITFAYLAWVDWRLTLVVSIPLVFGIGLYALQFRGYGAKMTAYNNALGAVNTAAIEFVQGIAVIKTFGQARQAYGRFIEKTGEFVDYFWNWVRGLLTISAASEIVMSPLFSIAMALVGGLVLVGGGTMPAVDVLPFVVLAPALTAPFLTLAFAQNDMMLAKEAAARIVSLLDTPVLAAPVSDARPENSRVAFDGVSFAYDGETEVLSKVDLVLEPGTVTALVGPSGSGKSTLARLLPRFWDPQAGSISIGKIALPELAPDVLYEQVGFVFQNVQLVRGTIAENIALGRPDATTEDIEAAARAAQIHDRIMELPHGYASVVGQDARLSGGEEQRISIARAILADAPIVVLDEATAFADPESEAAIQDALSHLIAGRTLLVIAHRLHTIVGADQICVMDEGRIVARGKHDDLLRESPLYRRLWSAGGPGRDVCLEAVQ
ncbi:MAG: ABC transporter ATP-binding protein [Pseudomonadota bacterium]